MPSAAIQLSWNRTNYIISACPTSGGRRSCPRKGATVPAQAQIEATHENIVIILGSTGTSEPGHVSVVMAETANRHAPTAD